MINKIKKINLNKVKIKIKNKIYKSIYINFKFNVYPKYKKSKKNKRLND
jgi:hypothetical protein